MPTLTQVERFRRAVNNAATLSTRQLAALWREFDLADAERTTRALLAAMPTLADRWTEVAAVLAVDAYDEWRDDAEVAGRFAAEPAPPPARGRIDALVRWGVEPLWSAEPAPALALTKLSGGLHRVVAGAARDTIVANVDRDPANPRYARHAAADACAFCAMLATRGAVYTSRDAAAGRYHDDCSCTPIVAWSPVDYEPAPYVARWQQAYDRAAAEASGTAEVLTLMRQDLGTN